MALDGGTTAASSGPAPERADSPLSLTLVTLKGDHKLDPVPRDASVDSLRSIVHSVSEVFNLGCPSPERQRVVYKGREIKSCTLEEAGVSDGSSFVVVERRDLVRTSRPDLEGGPSKETIDENTTRLAEEKGNVTRSSGRGGGGFDRSALTSINDIQQLLNAITTEDGGLGDDPLWDDPRLGNLVGDRAESDGDAGEDDEEADALLLEEREAAGDEQVPEANPARLNQLVEMGFSEALARKALIMRHNNLDAAMDWILEHQDDPDAEVPLTEAQLRRIAISRRRQRRNRRRFRRSWPRQVAGGVDPDPNLVTQLREMGFSENLSRYALQTFNNNMELACQWLLASADDFESDTDNSSQNSDGSNDEGAQPSGLEFQGSSGQFMQSLQELGGTLQDSRIRLRTLGLSSNPTVQQERLMHAFQAMIENPREARSYLTDPEIGPILLQVQRAQRVSSGITPTPEMNSESGDGGAQEDSRNADEPEE